MFMFLFMFMTKNAKMKHSSRGISYFWNIYTYLLKLVNFAVHLVLCLNRWVRTGSSIICNIVSNSFSLALSISYIPNKITWKLFSYCFITLIFLFTPYISLHVHHVCLHQHHDIITQPYIHFCYIINLDM